MQPRSFISRTMLLGAPVFLLFVAVNYFGDASLLFEIGYEEKMAEIILEGEMVENFYDFDERIFQKEVISNLDETPEVVVLGSSRGMLINTFTLDSAYTLMNNSVSGASVEDLIALYQTYRLNDHRPGRVILSFEPWTLNRNNEQGRWKSLKGEYQSFFDPNNYEPPGIPWDKYAQLFSPSYFQASLYQLIDGNGSRDPKRAKDPYNETNTKMPDGSLVYYDEYREAAPDYVDQLIRKYMEGDIYSIENFKELDAELRLQYEQLVDTLLAEEMELIIYLEPYHPIMLKEASENYPIVFEAERWLKKMAADRSLRVIGSFDHTKLDFDADDFYDAMHLKQSAVTELIQRNAPIFAP